jgi:hypothetical protein
MPGDNPVTEYVPKGVFKSAHSSERTPLPAFSWAKTTPAAVIGSSYARAPHPLTAPHLTVPEMVAGVVAFTLNEGRLKITNTPRISNKRHRVDRLRGTNQTERSVTSFGI